MAIHLDRQRPPKKRMGRWQRKGSKSNPRTGVQWANWLDRPGSGGGTPPTATGATAGTPGTFTPAGSTPPANIAGMAAVVASPATVWTTGQHVVLGDMTSAHWDGTAWAAGPAADPAVTAAKKTPRKK